MAADLALFPGVHVVLAIQPIGRGILADHQQFAHARVHQLFRLAQHRMGRARGQPPAHVRDDAELALVIAAFRNLQIAEVPGRQADASGGQQIDKGIGCRRHRGVYGIQHLFILVWAGDGQNARMMFADIIRLGAKAAGDDNLAIFLQRLTDGVQTFGLGTVEEPAGIDDHRIGARVIGRDAVSFGAQPGQDALTVHQRLGAAERHHAKGRLVFARGITELGFRGEVGAEVWRIAGHGCAYSTRVWLWEWMFSAGARPLWP